MDDLGVGALGEIEHGRQRLAAEPDLAVGVVLEDPEAVLGRELDQAAALLLREGAAGRVVEVGNDVYELRLVAVGECLLDPVDLDAVGLEGNADPVDAELLQHQQRAVVRRLLDDDLVARLEQGAEQHPTRFERAVGDHHPARVDAAVAVADPLAEPGMADSGSVGERAGGVLGQRRLSRQLDEVDGQQVGAGSAAGEGDRVGHRWASIGGWGRSLGDEFRGPERSQNP